MLLEGVGMLHDDVVAQYVGCLLLDHMLEGGLGQVEDLPPQLAVPGAEDDVVPPLCWLSGHRGDGA